MSVDESFFRMDKTKLAFGALGDDVAEREYWSGRSVEERFAAVEHLRQMYYGYHGATARLQRTIRVLELGES